MNAVYLKNFGLVPPRFIAFPASSCVWGLDSQSVIRLKSRVSFDFPMAVIRGVAENTFRKKQYGKIPVSPYIPSLMI